MVKGALNADRSMVNFSTFLDNLYLSKLSTKQTRCNANTPQTNSSQDERFND